VAIHLPLFSSLEFAMASRALPLYEIEIVHKGLHKHRIIRDRDPAVAQAKARAQQAAWEEMWEKRLDADQKRQQREQSAQEKQAQKELAVELTKEAEEAIGRIERILRDGVASFTAFSWESLKNTSEFPTPPPPKPTAPAPPPQLEIPKEPTRDDPKFQPQLGLLDKLFPSRARRKEEAAQDEYDRDHQEWQKSKRRVLIENKDRQAKYQAQLEKWRTHVLQRWENMVWKRWRHQKQKFLQEQAVRNKTIDDRKQGYLRGTPEGVADFAEQILSRSCYPDSFPQEFDLDFSAKNKLLVVDFSLPSLDALPKVKQVKYVQATNELKEIPLAENALAKLYDTLLYEITLRSLHELFSADCNNAIAAIVFNGWVRSIDKSTGQEVNACILSVQASRQEFAALNLVNVEAKACFKSLKGVGSSKLHGLTPIAPILQINREDRRFISSHEVAHVLDDSFNLAAMDWQDFEHLIRELFEKEFSQAGGEVKVTQASRDGGVDVVAFDPDPIRGGKIVIQAKRYTNVVTVSAVRDLYGTLMNEGATKGILITTSEYGPDAYDFARGKPITLLNGANLLHMLEKHGHRARIDLKEAKQVLAEKERLG
jgi:restriction system protein